MKLPTFFSVGSTLDLRTTVGDGLARILMTGPEGALVKFADRAKPCTVRFCEVLTARRVREAFDHLFDAIDLLAIAGRATVEVA